MSRHLIIVEAGSVATEEVLRDINQRTAYCVVDKGVAIVDSDHANAAIAHQSFVAGFISSGTADAERGNVDWDLWPNENYRKAWLAHATTKENSK